MKRVLLTGGTGFIGRHAGPLLLERGYEVHAVYSKTEPPPDAITWHRADLLEPGDGSALVQRLRPTHLLHLAWYAEHGKFWSSPENLRWVEASLRLVRAFAAEGGRRVVVAGTCAEYDWCHGFCSEKVTPLAPATLYGSCKNALHSILSPFGKEAGISVAWGRIFFLYGPGEHPNRLVSSVIRALLTGSPADCSSGTQIRDFLYSKDVASAFVRLLDSDVEGPVNVASGVPVSVRDMVCVIGELIGRTELLRLGALPDRSDDPPLLVGDSRRLRAEVGWSPRVPLTRGIEETVEWWRKRI